MGVGVRVSANFRENKMYWKEVDSLSKTREQIGTLLKGQMGK